MANPKVKFKRSSVSGKSPSTSDLPLGELAINTYDGIVYTAKSTDNGITTSIVNISGIRIEDEGSLVGYANTINFVGSGVTVLSFSNGVGIVSFTAGGGGGGGESYWTSTTAGIHTLSNVGIGTTNPTSTLTVKGNTSLETLNVSGVATVSQLFTDHSLLASGILTTVSTSQTTLVSYPLATYRSAKLNVQISCGSTHRITELLMVHNGTEIFMTEYGSMSTTEADFEVSNLASFTSDINSGNFRILATPASAGLTTFKYVSNLITV